MRNWAVIAVLLLTGARAEAGQVSVAPFGRLPTGQSVDAITLTERGGYRATVITLGASLQAMVVPDARGRPADVALGHRTVAEYLAPRQFMGSTVGRVANRINSARFSLNGRPYRVSANDGANALHGGAEGFDRANWEVVSTRHGPDFAEVVLRHVSADGDQGFPGRVTATVRYRLEADGELHVAYEATTDAPTAVSLSHHGYWNLAGEGASQGALEHVLQIPADAYLPVTDTLIPTGEFRAVQGTNFDFRTPRVIRDRVRDADDDQIRIGRGYDHNWVVTRAPTPTQHRLARLTDPASGRVMELWSNQPGLQFYSGNFINATTRGKSGRLYRMGDGIVLEAQAFPDTVNQPAFGSVRLEPGQTYRNEITYRFSTTGRNRR